MTLFQKSILGLAGATALGIGAAILIAPAGFYATYGISLGSDPSLLNEMRAPGGALLTMGLFMLAGLVRPGLAQMSRWIAAGVFLSYGLSRLLSFTLNGAPDGGLMLAALFKITIGALCLTPPGTRRHKGPGRPRFAIPQNRYPT
ncbi:MAG TPA: DUF4345 domain-containing protein [Roseovarius sp.]